MIRKLRQNPTPSNSANRRTRRPVLNDEAELRTDEEGEYVRIPIADIADGPVLVVAWDGTPGTAEAERGVYGELGRAAYEYLRDSEHKPDRAAALDRSDEPQATA